MTIDFRPEMGSTNINSGVEKRKVREENILPISDYKNVISVIRFNKKVSVFYTNDEGLFRLDIEDEEINK